MSVEVWVNQDEKTISILNVVGETKNYIHTTDGLVLNERTMRYYQIVRPHMKWLVSKTTKRFDKALLDSDQYTRNEFMDTLRDTFGLDLAEKDEINAIAFPVENRSYDNPQSVFLGCQAVIEKTMYEQDKRIFVYTDTGFLEDTVPIKNLDITTISLKNNYDKEDGKTPFQIVTMNEDAIFAWLFSEINTIFSKGRTEKLNRVVETIPTFTFVDGEKYKYKDIYINDKSIGYATYYRGKFSEKSVQLNYSDNQWLFGTLEEEIEEP